MYQLSEECPCGLSCFVSSLGSWVVTQVTYNGTLWLKTRSINLKTGWNDGFKFHYATENSQSNVNQDITSAVTKYWQKDHISNPDSGVPFSPSYLETLWVPPFLSDECRLFPVVQSDEIMKLATNSPPFPVVCCAWSCTSTYHILIYGEVFRRRGKFACTYSSYYTCLHYNIELWYIIFYAKYTIYFTETIYINSEESKNIYAF
jgi:hypothetical protein